MAWPEALGRIACVFLAFALLCGEQLWIATAFFGLYLCVVRRRWREGLFLSLLTFYG